MGGSTGRRQGCARQRRPIRRSSSSRKSGMTNGVRDGNNNVWALHLLLRERPPANHLLAMSLTLLLARSATAAAAAAVATGAPLRAGGGDAPAVLLAPATHGEKNEAEMAVQWKSQQGGKKEMLLLGTERMRRVLYGWGGEDGADRGVEEEAGDEQENTGLMMGMSTPVEEEVGGRAREISTAKWFAGPGQGKAAAGVVDAKNGGAPAAAVAAGPEGEAWFGAPGAGAEVAASGGDQDAGMMDAFVAAGGAWGGRSEQFEGANSAATAAAAVNLRAPGVAMGGGKREGSAQDSRGDGDADGETGGVPAEVGAPVAHGNIVHGKKLESLAVDLEHGLHDQAHAAAAAALAADVAASAAKHAGEEAEGPVVDRLQEDGNAQGAGMAVLPPPDDAAAREQIKYPQPVPKPPARPVKRWIHKSDLPADKGEGGTAAEREGEQRGELGFGQQQQQQQQLQQQQLQQQQLQQQQLLHNGGVENRAWDAWESGVDGGGGFRGEKEAGWAEGGGGERPAGTMPGTRAAAAAAAGNETEAKSLVDAKVGLASLRTIETEVEKHVEELLGLFTAEAKGGRKYQAAAQGVQEEVEDIRSELVKLLRTLNTTDEGILGAEHEMQKKELELVQLHAIEEVEGAKDKLTDGKVKVDYATGKIRWDEEDIAGDPKGDKVGTGGDADGSGGDAKSKSKSREDMLKSRGWRKEVEMMKEEWDPALLHLDANLLRDFVVLCMSAALGGVLAAGVGLPETLGYIVGGMVVGPSGVNVIRMVKEVETFAQFGSIFLLFGHGLTYSTFMNTGRPSANVYAPQGRMGAFTVLFVVFSALLVCAAVLGIEDGVSLVF
ncbi:unnamed protein product, partial [Ectocarpus fasciculatus]